VLTASETVLYIFQFPAINGILFTDFSFSVQIM